VRREILLQHKFPEDFRRAEENFFLQELEKEHRRMFYHPKLRVGHYRRENFKGLIRPTVGGGFWRSRLLRTHKGRGNIYWLPAIFVVGHFLILFDVTLFINLARVYGLIILFVSMGLSSRRNRMLCFPLVGLLHYVIVMLYGVGFLLERAGLKWK
jgi:hypothetical protein